jgi:hypothetical protein
MSHPGPVDTPARPRPFPARALLILLVAALGAAAGALALFPRAFPTIALRQRLTRDDAVARATAFVREHQLHDARARTAVQFGGNDSVRTFLDLGGGKDSLDAVVRGTDLALYTWSVRFFTPQDPREATVRFAPDGRLVGFRRRLADTDERPALDEPAARALAETVVARWAGRDLSRYRLQAANYRTVNPSQRVDRTFTWERTDRTIGGAPLRLDVVIAGDTPAGLSEYVVIPERFQRRYGEMRASNDFLALLASAGIVLWALLAMRAVWMLGREHLLRWGPALATGLTIGALLAAAQLNGLPDAWFAYDTASSPEIFRVFGILSAVLGGGVMGVVIAVSLVAGEGLTRLAFPWQLDWWKLWRYRGTREVAGNVLGGYALVAFVFLYVALFYVVTRRAFGWWVPSEVLDDPNLIATPFPWLAALAISAQAAVWEEALFRAVPLATLALLVRGRPHARWLMAGGVALSALVFGFAHANYPSWPPYSRGVELFVDATAWALVYLRFGLPVTILAHFLYDLLLFGLFAGAGDALPYRITLAVVALIGLAPALVVGWRALRQRGLVPAPADALLAAWRPAPPATLEEGPSLGRPALTPLARRVGLAAVLAGAVGVATLPAEPVLGPRYTIPRERAQAVAESVLAARGVAPSEWRRLTAARTGGLGDVEALLRRADRETLAESLATSYLRLADWEVRYVRTTGDVAARTEEWRVHVAPDGAVVSVDHQLPQDAPGDSLTPDAARALARAALDAAGIAGPRLHEARLDQTARPKRIDTVVEYVDSAVALPSGATARIRVSLEGSSIATIRRRVEVPESFQREERARGERAGLVAMLSGLVLVGLTIGGATLMLRRRLPLVWGVELSRPQKLGVVGVLVALQLLAAWNARDASQLGWDTATPWSTFVASNLLGDVLGAVFVALFTIGVVQLSNALRHRVGIPFWPTAPGSAGARDALLGGLALALFPAAFAAFPGGVAPDTIPSPPGTLLDQRSPLLAALLTTVDTALLLPAIASLPLLVIAGWSRRRVLPVVALVAAAALLASAGDRVAPEVTHNRALLFAGGLAVLLVFVVAARAWALVSAASWVVAALATAAVAAAGAARSAGNATERTAWLVTALASIAAIVALWWHMQRRAETPLPGEPAIAETAPSPAA